MLTLEYIFLTLTYTSLCIALFLQWLCYRRKIENIETIAFTASLLLLIISISLSPLFPVGNTSSLSTLVCMAIVAVTTLLNTLSERKYDLKSSVKKASLIIASLLITAAFVTHYTGYLVFIQFAIVAFLVISVIASIGITYTAKPIKIYEHLEGSNRILGAIFLIIVPLYLVLHYGFEEAYQSFPIGVLLYVAFTLMALHKIYDDLQRLSLINQTLEPKKQHFKNFGLTEREEEIARLLVQGITYQSIADQLFISLPTVKTHASNIYKKCNVKTRHELTFILTN